MEKEIIKFGSYYQNNNETKEPLEWYILDKVDTKLLLLSKNIIDSIEFNDKLASTTWEKSLIRQWLNNDFIKNTFNDEEFVHIQTTRVKTIDGAYNNVNGGNATNDKVFLLSVEELEKYNPKSIHIAVLYNFTNLTNPEQYLIGLTLNEKKWIVFPWETKLEV